MTQATLSMVLSDTRPFGWKGDLKQAIEKSARCDQATPSGLGAGKQRSRNRPRGKATARNSTRTRKRKKPEHQVLGPQSTKEGGGDSSYYSE